MNTGLTIAFICNGNNHSTIINYKNFGNQFWDDTQNNNSKIGYYFAYYFQQKYVYIHKIINILQPNERPSSMIWSSNRQILCLSKQLKKFTWNEWISGIGIGAPYTPNYRMTQTGSWSHKELQNHKKYNKFNFINFKNVVENQPTTITTSLPIYDVKYDYKDEVADEDEIEELRKKLKEAETRKREKEIRKNIVKLRENHNEILRKRQTEIDEQIKRLIADREQIEVEITANTTTYS